MKTLLIFPPVMWNFGPHLGLPSLTAFLRNEGFQVEQRDINAELHDIVFSQVGLSKIHKDSWDRFSALNGKSQLSTLEQEEYMDLLAGPASTLPAYVNRVEGIRNAFKNPVNYMIPPGKVRPPLEQFWGHYSRIKALAIPDDKFLFDLPSYSLQYLFDLVEGRSKLPYHDLLVDLVSQMGIVPRPDIVGISFVVSSQVFPGLFIAYLIKKRFPHAHVVVGGPFWTIMRHSSPYLIDRLPFVDSVALYEGEYTLVELIQALKKGKDLSTVPNLVTRNSTHGIKDNTYLIKDINTLPCPDYGGLNLSLYFTPHPVLTYASARGCYYNRCAFCNFQSPDARYRTRKVDLIIRDLKKLTLDFGNLFYFSQECETPARFEEIADAILKNKIDIYYEVFARFDSQFNRRILRKMKESGCQYVFFGLEAGSQRVNDLMKKGVNLEDAKRIINDCSAVGQNIVVSSIQGFPTENADEFQATENFYQVIRDAYSHRIRITGSSHFFRLPRGSLVDRNPERFGVKSIYRSAAGELAPTYPGYLTNSGHPGVNLSGRLKEYKNKQQEILFNEHIVLIISSLNGDRVLSLDTVRDGNENSSKLDCGDRGLNRSKLVLNGSVRLIRCNFNLRELQRRSCYRREVALKRFIDEGLPISQIVERFCESEVPPSSQPCLLAVNVETGNLVMISPSLELLIRRCEQEVSGATLRDELTSFGLPDRPDDLSRLLSKLIANNILSQRTS
jgi:radical SAM superfamily enzyme YgiQ (UPF0313 family)